MNTLNAFGWLPLSVVLCGLVAGWLLFLNFLKKDDPDKDFARILLSAVLGFGPFGWTRWHATDFSLERSLIVLVNTGVVAVAVMSLLLMQSKRLGEDAAAKMSVSRITIGLCALLVLGYGLFSWYDHRQNSQLQTLPGKSGAVAPR